MMLGKLPVPRCPTNLDDSGAMGQLGWLVGWLVGWLFWA